jgi:hypothetical protein
MTSDLSEREDSDDDIDFGSQINKGNPKGHFYKKLLPVLLFTMFLACKLLYSILFFFVRCL